MCRGLVLLFLVLVLETRWSESSCQQPESQRPASNEGPSLRVSAHNLLKRYNDIDYDSFVGLMGRRNADADDSIPSQRKREMHDIFVGLMGRRSSDSGLHLELFHLNTLKHLKLTVKFSRCCASVEERVSRCERRRRHLLQQVQTEVSSGIIGISYPVNRLFDPVKTASFQSISLK